MTNLIKKGVIYIIEHNNYPDFKYVGKTVDGLNKRWNGHLSTFKQFNRMYYRLCFYVNYYGVENFTIREYKIYNNITQEYLNNEEKKYIFEIGTLNTQNSNNNITIKITNELRNELLKKLINKDINISNLYKVIYTFSYDYKRDILDFSLNDENKTLLNNLLKKEIKNKLIDMEIHITYDNTFKISCEFLNDEIIIDDYIKYINYFHKEFEITNNNEDIYYSSDLVYGLEQYGDENELFDYYFIIDFKNILQHYFNILNISYDNININLNNNILYGIKKKNIVSFKLYKALYDVILSFLENVDYNKEYDFTDFIYCNLDNEKSTTCYEPDDIYMNKLFIEVLDENLYTIWNSIYIKKLKYDTKNEEYDGTDEFIIMDKMDYSYDYNNLEYISNNLISILKSIVERYNGIFKIIDDTYIMLDKL